MPTNWTIERIVDFARPAIPYRDTEPIDLMLPGDHLAHTLKFECYENGEPVDMTGLSVAGHFRRSKDGNTVVVTGLASGNVVTVTLTQECYAYEGELRGVVKVTDTDTGAKITICDRKFNVKRDVDDNGTISPGQTIPDIDDLLAEIADMREATANAEAAASLLDGIAPYNTVDLLALYGASASTTVSGIQFTLIGRNKYRATGTATATAYANVYHMGTGVFVAGETYNFRVSTTSASLRLVTFFYDNTDTIISGTSQYITSDRRVTIPAGAVKTSVYVQVPNGATVNGAEIEFYCVTGLSNAELDAKIDSVEAEASADIAELQNATFDGIVPYNAVDLVTLHGSLASATVDGVQFTAVGRNGYTATGTATADAYANVYHMGTGVFEPGATYHFRVSTTDSNLRLVAFFYDSSDAIISGASQYMSADRDVTIPDNAVKTSIYVRVENGATVDGAEIEFYCLTGPANAELDAKIDSVEAEASADIAELKSALDETTFDIAQMCGAPTQHTHNGITFTRNGSVYTANGTATDTAFVNIFVSRSSLPIGVKAGNKLRFYVSTSDITNLRCVVLFFDESGTQIGNTYFIAANRIIDLPADLRGIQIRVQVTSGTTMTNGTISVRIYPNVYDNDAYAEFKAADDCAVVNRAIDEILDGKNLLDYSLFSEKTHNGVLFKKLDDNTIQIQGTATDTAFANLYANEAAIPAWMSKNKQYYLTYSSENVAILVLPRGGAATASLVNTTGDSSFSLPDDTVGLIIQLKVESGTTVDETVLPIITETLPDKLLPKTLEKVVGSVYRYQDIHAQASGDLIHVDDVSPLTLVNVSDLIENHDIIVCGKNIYHNPHNYTTYTQGNVTKIFSEVAGTIIVSSSGATNDVTYPQIISSLNGIGWAGLYKFSLPMDAVVTITPNASRDLFVYDRIYLQFSDGTSTWPVRGKSTTLLCKANTEYGLRVRVDTGYNETVTLKPQIEINGFPTDFEPFTGVYTQDGSIIAVNDRTTSPVAITAKSNTINVISQSGSVTLAYVRMNRIDKGVDAFSREKMPIPQTPLMLTFIDDDTTNYALVKLYHDTMQELGVVGNYAVITNHLDADSTLRDLLLEYESEGFGMLCHASNQSGEHTDYFRPWEYRDIDAVRENMIAGLRYMRQTGFISGSFWATPYGVDDPEIKQLAKSLGFQGLISGMNYTPSFRGYTSRYEIPRYSIEYNDLTKQGMDACIPNGGWVIVTTHANTWGDDAATYKARIGELINYANTIGMKVVNFQEGFETFFGSD